MTEGRFKTLFFTFLFAIIACMGYMVCGTWIGWSSTAIYQMKNNQTELDVTNYGTMISMYDLGNMISPIPCGYVLGLYGRKRTISVIGPMNMIAWTMMLTWPSRLDVLYLARLFAGLAKGMTICSVPMYVGEIAEVKLRGAVLSMLPISLAFGMLSTQTIGQFLNYRQLNFLGLSLATVFTFLFLLMPESPYYLMQKDRKDEAEKSLRRIRAKDDVAEELAMIEETVTKQMQSKTTYRELFMTKSNRRAFIITTGACVFQRLSGISPFIHFTSITLPSKNYWLNPLVAVVVFSVIKNIGNMVPLFLVDWIGRKPLMVLSHSAMALATAAYAVSLYAVANENGGSSLAWLPVVLLWVYVLSYSLGAGTLAYLLLGEMFAANVKTKAAPLCVMLQSSASFLLDSIYTFVTQAFGVHSNYFIYSALNFIWAVAAVFVMIETKGKTFLEIEEMLAA